MPFSDYVSKLWQVNKDDITNQDGSAVKNKAVTAISDIKVGGLSAKTFNISGTYKGPDSSSILYAASKTEYGTHTYYVVNDNSQKIQINFPTDYANGNKIIGTITFK